MHSPTLALIHELHRRQALRARLLALYDFHPDYWGEVRWSRSATLWRVKKQALYDALGIQPQSHEARIVRAMLSSLGVVSVRAGRQRLDYFAGLRPTSSLTA